MSLVTGLLEEDLLRVEQRREFLAPELHYRQKLRKLEQVHRRPLAKARKKTRLELHKPLEQVDEDSPDPRVVPKP